MPDITLPDDLRDAINDAFGSELNRQIGRGSVDAILTCNEGLTGTKVCVIEFKARNGPRVAYRGEFPAIDSTEWVALQPEPWVKPEAINQVGMDRGELALKQLPSRRGHAPNYRVVLTPPGSSTVYMALEALARDSESVRMNRVDLFPNKDPKPAVEL